MTFSNCLTHSLARRARFYAVGAQAVLSASVPLVLIGCNGETNDPVASTDTGNPPVVDQRKLRVTARDGGVTVSGEAGAVEPGGAEVEVTNLTSGDSATVIAEDDGSFEVELEGSVDDEYRVEATSDNQSDRVTISADNGSSNDGDSPADDAGAGSTEPDVDEPEPSAGDSDTGGDEPEPADNEPAPEPDTDAMDTDEPGTGDGEPEPSVDAGSEPPADAGVGNDLEPFDGEFLLNSSEGFTLVDGTTLSITLSEDGDFGFSAGCNSHGGSYTFCDGRLCTEGFFSTEIGCAEELHDQDDWLSDFFGSTPAVVLDAPELTFSTDDATLVFLDREVADPDVELTAGTWLIDSFIQGQGVTNYGFDTDPTIEFSEDGSFEFTTPCNSGSGGYEVNGDELIIGQASWTERGCVSESAREAESIMLETLGAGSGVSFEIDARRLWIRAGDVGFGAMLE